MDWQTLTTAFETWLWSSPYLDVPNYAWLAAGLGLAIMVVYLFALRLEQEPEEASREDAPAPGPEEVPNAPEQEAPEPEPQTRDARPAAPQPEPVTPPEPEAPPEEVEEEEVELVPPEGWLTRLRTGLSKTQGKFTSGLAGLLSRGKVDQDLLEELEELLITSDLGVKTSTGLLEKLGQAVREEGLDTGDKVKNWLKAEIAGILGEAQAHLEIPPDHQGPFVIMVTGVNGTGKTTTIGKLAMRYKQEGRSVLIGAADTFRAAAIEQLEIWAKRAGAALIKHQEGADPSAVAFDTVKAALARKAEVVIIDTAGRLHTKVNLMEELKKVQRITARELEGAPHEVLLVLDATTGQNAVQQAKTFDQALGVTGIVLTKLDGTAKGGIIVAISHEFKIPIRFIGVGEKIYDLQPFNASEFVEALF